MEMWVERLIHNQSGFAGLIVERKPGLSLTTPAL